jgi:hypothetical protein
MHFHGFFFTGQVRVQVMSFEAQSEDAGLGAVSESAICRFLIGYGAIARFNDIDENASYRYRTTVSGLIVFFRVHSCLAWLVHAHSSLEHGNDSHPFRTAPFTFHSMSLR